MAPSWAERRKTCPLPTAAEGVSPGSHQLLLTTLTTGGGSSSERQVLKTSPLGVPSLQGTGHQGCQLSCGHRTSLPGAPSHALAQGSPLPQLEGSPVARAPLGACAAPPGKHRARPATLLRGLTPTKQEAGKTAAEDPGSLRVLKNNPPVPTTLQTTLEHDL